MRHPPLIVRPVPSPSMLAWVWQTLMNCNAKSYAINKARMVRIAEYSRDVLKALRAETGIAYDERMQGTLQLFRQQKQVDGAHIALCAELLPDGVGLVEPRAEVVFRQPAPEVRHAAGQ